MKARAGHKPEHSDLCALPRRVYLTGAPFAPETFPFTENLWYFCRIAAIMAVNSQSAHRGEKGSYMQILEHQSLYLNNLISYKLHIPREKTPFIIQHILDNIGSLNLQLSGKILFTEDIYQYRNMEILIPVDQKFEACEQYGKKEAFKLINAVSARHEGAFSETERTEQQLLDYIRSKSYQAITPPYYSIVRLDETHVGSCILDIYIGVNYNIL